MARITKKATSDSNARPVKYELPTSFSAARMAPWLMLTATKMSPLKAAAAPADAIKRPCHASTL